MTPRPISSARPPTWMRPSADTSSSRRLGRPICAPWRTTRLAGKARPCACSQPQVGAGRAGGRVLVHAAAGLGEEIARLDHLPAGFDRAFVESEQIRGLASQAAFLPAVQLRAVRQRATHRVHAAQRHQQLVRAGIDPDGIAQQVILVQADQAGDLGAAQRRRGGADSVRTRRGEGPGIALRRHRHHARLELQGQRIPGLQQVAHHLRGAQRGVAGELHFVAGREDAHARIRLLGRQDEGGFGQIELRGQLQHDGVVQAARVLEHTELVAAEGGVVGGEDVEQAEGVIGHGERARESLGWAADTAGPNTLSQSAAAFAAWFTRWRRTAPRTSRTAPGQPPAPATPILCAARRRALRPTTARTDAASTAPPASAA